MLALLRAVRARAPLEVEQARLVVRTVIPPLDHFIEVVLDLFASYEKREALRTLAVVLRHIHKNTRRSGITVGR